MDGRARAVLGRELPGARGERAVGNLPPSLLLPRPFVSVLPLLSPLWAAAARCHSLCDSGFLCLPQPHSWPRDGNRLGRLLGTD